MILWNGDVMSEHNILITKSEFNVINYSSENVWQKSDLVLAAGIIKWLFFLQNIAMRSKLKSNFDEGILFFCLLRTQSADETSNMIITTFQQSEYKSFWIAELWNFKYRLDLPIQHPIHNCKQLWTANRELHSKSELWPFILHENHHFLV